MNEVMSSLENLPKPSPSASAAGGSSAGSSLAPPSGVPGASLPPGADASASSGKAGKGGLGTASTKTKQRRSATGGAAGGRGGSAADYDGYGYMRTRLLLQNFPPQIMQDRSTDCSRVCMSACARKGKTRSSTADKEDEEQKRRIRGMCSASCRSWFSVGPNLLASCEDAAYIGAACQEFGFLPRPVTRSAVWREQDPPAVTLWLSSEREAHETTGVEESSLGGPGGGRGSRVKVFLLSYGLHFVSSAVCTAGANVVEGISRSLTF